MSFSYQITHVNVATQIDHKLYAALKAIDPSSSVARLVREAIERYVVAQQRRNSEGQVMKDDGSYLWERCYSCGHRLAFSSDSCPQCGIHFDGRKGPKKWPEKCDCERCTKARSFMAQQRKDSHE